MGLFFYLQLKETFENNEQKTNTNDNAEKESSDCPDLLIQQNGTLMLLNSKKPKEVGINPILFSKLDDYIKYLEVQKQNGTDCPVLFLQKENNAQGDDVYRMRPSPFDLQGGLPPMNTLYKDDIIVNQPPQPPMPSPPLPPPPIPPVIPSQPDIVNQIDASREDAPFNSNQYAGFDPQNQYIGIYTDIDNIHDSTKAQEISDNPMDENWGGVIYTQQMIDSGKYNDYNITKPVLFQPRTAYYTDIPTTGDKPKDFM